VLHEQPDRFIVDVELPGASESDIHYTIDGQQLTVNASRSLTSEKRDDQGNIVESDQRAGDFREILRLPGPVQTSEVTSHFDNGVLEISIPRQSGDTEA
jgi:HSP20 family protein